jgi:hypothetical protein
MPYPYLLAININYPLLFSRKEINKIPLASIGNIKNSHWGTGL